MVAYDYCCCDGLNHDDLILKTCGGHHALNDWKMSVCPDDCRILFAEILTVIFFYLKLHYIIYTHKIRIFDNSY